jgi:diacylglycerol kinase family enzyme
MSREGPTGRTVPTGTVMWSGAVTLLAGATIPFFGFGLKMFAFAGARADRFHLRCADVGFFEALRSVPAAFRGEYFSDNVHDFLVEKVAIELDEDAAVEAGGELLGKRRHVDLAIGAPVTLVALAEG